jgi:hypothetical protein
MNNSSFAEGFFAIHGRYPTQADIADLRNRQTQKFNAMYPKPPGTAEKITQALSPLIGLGGLYLGKNVLGGMLGSGGASALSGSGGSSALGGGLSLGGAGASTAGGAGVSLPSASMASSASSLGSGLASSLLPLGVALGTGYLAKETFDSMQDGDSNGALKNSIMLNPMFAPFAYAGSKMFGSGKDGYQQSRDDIRSTMQSLGILDDNYQGFNGADMSKDGGFRFDDGRKVYEVASGQEDGTANFTLDQSNAIGGLNPLGWILGQGTRNKESAGYGTGLLYNTLGQDGNVTNDEIKSVYDKAGLNQIDASLALEMLGGAGKITQDEQLAGIGGLNTLYGQNYESPEDKAERITRLRDRLFGGLL